MPAFVIRWVATALAIGVAAQVLPGIQVDGLWAAIVAALLLGLVNVTLRPILLLLLGLGVWLATRLMGGAISYAQGLTIACFAEFPRLVEAVSTAVQAMLMDESALTGRYSVSLGVGRFFDPDTAKSNSKPTGMR